MPIINGRACVAYRKNLLSGVDSTIHQAPGWFQWIANVPTEFIKVGEPLCFSAFINNAPYAKFLRQGSAYCMMQAKDSSGKILLEQAGNEINFDVDGVSQGSLIVPDKTDSILLFVKTNNMGQNTYYGYPKVEFGTTATPLNPTPVDKAFSNGKQVYGRNFAIDSHDSTSNTTSSDTTLIRKRLSEDLSGKVITTTAKVIVTNYQGKIDSNNGNGPFISIIDGFYTDNWKTLTDQIPITGNGVYTSSPTTTTKHPLTGTANMIGVQMYNLNATIEVWIKLELGTTATPWTPAPEDVM